MSINASAQPGLFDPPPKEVSWKTTLEEERAAEYFKTILSFLESERSSGKTIYPKNSEVFAALQHTALENVNVVILGQDPYHGPGQAHGLCFSVLDGVVAPPSLKNIFKELSADIGVPEPSTNNLEAWARQGILLLNTSLTVEAGKAASHSQLGWMRFTDKVIQVVNEHRSGVIFLLWGSHAQKKSELIDGTRHHILKAPHPSPLSAHRGFLGCKHFSKTNELLSQQGKQAIDWSL